jgi:hypothetical protein
VNNVQERGEELADSETEGGAADGAAVAFGDVSEVAVGLWIVGGGEGRGCGVSEEHGGVDGSAAAVSARDDDARGGVDGSVEDVMAGTHDVVARVHVEERGEKAVGEEALRCAADGGGAELLAEGSAVCPVVGLAVGELTVAGRGDEGEEGGDSGEVAEADDDFVAGGDGLRGLAGGDVLGVARGDGVLGASGRLTVGEEVLSAAEASRMGAN